jgi:hypothetical protein
MNPMIQKLFSSTEVTNFSNFYVPLACLAMDNTVYKFNFCVGNFSGICKHHIQFAIMNITHYNNK